MLTSQTSLVHGHLRALRWEKDLHVLGACLPFNVGWKSVCMYGNCQTAQLLRNDPSGKFSLLPVVEIFYAGKGPSLSSPLFQSLEHLSGANPVEVFFDGFHRLAVRSLAHDPSRHLTQILVRLNSSCPTEPTRRFG